MPFASFLQQSCWGIAQCDKSYYKRSVIHVLPRVLCICQHYAIFTSLASSPELLTPLSSDSTSIEFDRVVRGAFVGAGNDPGAESACG